MSADADLEAGFLSGNSQRVDAGGEMVPHLKAGEAVAEALGGPPESEEPLVAVRPRPRRPCRGGPAAMPTAQRDWVQAVCVESPRIAGVRAVVRQWYDGLSGGS